MKRPNLVVRTGSDGIERIVVQYDPGDERAAFQLLERTSGALQELDQAVRSTADEPATSA